MEAKPKLKPAVKKVVVQEESSCSSDNGEDQAVTSESEESQIDDVSNPVRNELQSELNKMSFEDIQKLQNKLGLKKYCWC
jgi:hypothetical protein